MQDSKGHEPSPASPWARILGEPGRARAFEYLEPIAVGLAVLLFAWLSITLTRASGQIAAIWPVNALVLARVLHADVRRWPSLMLGGLVGNLCANLVVGDEALVAAGLGACNSIEVLVAAWGLRRVLGRNITLSRARDLLVFVGVAGLLAPSVSALLASGLLHLVNGASFGRDLLLWTAADGLGLLVMTPPLLALTPKAIARLSAEGRGPRNAVALGGAMIVFLAVGQSARAPLFLAWPALLLLTFEMEIIGAALGLLMMTAASVGFALAGRGPTNLWHLDPNLAAMRLQLFLAISAFCMWPVAARLAQFRLAQANLAASRDRAKQTAAELLEAQNLTRLAGQTAGLAYWRFDLATQALIESDGVVVGASHDADAPDADKLWSSVHPDDKARLLAGIRKAVRRDGEFSDHIRVRGADGAYRTVIVRGARQHGTSGEVTSVLGAMFDVTEFKRMETAAAESERRYRVLAEKVNDIIIWSTLGGRNTFVSPACQAVLGCPSEDLLGFKTINRIHPDDRAHVRRIFKAMISGRREHASEPVTYRFEHSDGHWIWLAGNPTLLFDERGQPSGFVDVVRDVTANKLVEAELLAARAAAESATSAKTDFLANMSHELRTPLTAIMGFSSLLQEREDLPEAAALYVQRISTAGKSLLAVVNDVLDFSKLEAGQLELDPHPFDPAALIKDTLDILDAQASNKGLSLRLEIAPDLPERVAADSARLRQILLNLLSNAVKFTAQGSITVRVREAAPSQPQAAPAHGEMLHFSVTDTGEGIPADRRNRLFQRFSQADESISRNHGGTGLGLAICKSLVELMGGTIGVESDEGRGSTFWFTITAPAVAQSDIAPVEDARPAFDLDLKAARILVVDDVEVNRELVRAMLAPFGYSFQDASNGAEAVQAALHAPFDLILMDLQMPGMDGIAAARTIRATSVVNRDTPIVALSANVLPNHLEACWAAGMNDHIAKPIVPMALLTKVAQWTSPEVMEDEAYEAAAAGVL
jgi:PAS domain S-box-containing protein